MANRLKNRVFPEIEYTLHDDIVTQLLAVTVCPITQESSDNCIIFNHQCYDKDAWEKHVRTEQRENRSGVRRGTRRAGDNNRLKCPHTGENFSVNEALRKVYETLDRRKMKVLIENRVDLLAREWQRFAPNSASVSANEFAAHLVSLGEMSKDRRDLYNDYIANRRSVADVNPQTESPPNNATLDGSLEVSESVPNETTNTSNEPASTSEPTNSNEDSTLSGASNTSNINHPPTQSATTTSNDERPPSETSVSNPSNLVSIVTTSATTTNRSSHNSDTSPTSNTAAVSGTIFEYNEESSDTSSSTDVDCSNNENNVALLPNPNEIVDIPDEDSSESAIVSATLVGNEMLVEGVVDDVLNETNSHVESVDGSVESNVEGTANDNVGTNRNTENEMTEVQNAMRNHTRTWTKDEILGVDRESWSWPPNFLRTRAGQAICLAMLTAARTEGFSVTLDYPYRTDWFNKMFEVWYQPMGILGRYKIVKPKDLRLKFKKCENEARKLYDARQHQADPSGNLDETDVPLFFAGFRNYFDHSEAPASERARIRVQQQRNVVVNRSLIGQQAGLNTTDNDTPVLNATTRPTNRTRGYSEMAADVVVRESSPRRRLAPNDGRGAVSVGGSSSSTRTRRYNVDYGMASSLSLPPSTAGTSGVDINGMENRFNAIASSINQLGMSHMSRHTTVIYDDIIKAMQDKAIAERNGCSEELLRIYQSKIDDLFMEKEYANRYMRQYYQSIIRDTNEDEEAVEIDDQTDNTASMQE